MGSTAMFKMLKLFNLQLTLILFLMMSVNGQTAKNEWQGIKPLYSSKENIEMLLGSPVEKKLNLYETENEKVTVFYSGKSCKRDKKSKWNVPKNTVLAFIISPKNALDPSVFFGNSYVDFEKSQDSSKQNSFNYTNADGSIKFQTTYLKNGKEDLIFIVYSPTKEDAIFRCMDKFQ